jgi:hypothetical protein
MNKEVIRKRYRLGIKMNKKYYCPGCGKAEGKTMTHPFSNSEKICGDKICGRLISISKKIFQENE